MMSRLQRILIAGLSATDRMILIWRTSMLCPDVCPFSCVTYANMASLQIMGFVVAVVSS